MREQSVIDFLLTQEWVNSKSLIHIKEIPTPADTLIPGPLVA